jgi:hypothetical protein
MPPGPLYSPDDQRRKGETMMNANAFHNILNIVAALLGLLIAIMLYLGCVQLPSGDLDCSASSIPPSLAGWLLAAFGILKGIVNMGRDGIGGLFKRQPPVQK